MAGVVLPVLQKRVFDFGHIPVGSAMVVTVAEHLDISQYTDCVLEVRTHESTLSGGQIAVDLFGDGFTKDDPSLTFLTQSALISEITAPDAVGLKTSAGTAFGHFATLVIRGVRTSISPLNAALSVDLILRTPDDT